MYLSKSLMTKKHIKSEMNKNNNAVICKGDYK